MSQQHCNFFLSSRDIRFLKKITRKRPMGQTRWPSIFSSLDVIGSHKKQTKLKYFFKLRILVFQCPGRTHITNFTRMPHQHHRQHLCQHLRQQQTTCHDFWGTGRSSRSSWRGIGLGCFSGRPACSWKYMWNIWYIKYSLASTSLEQIWGRCDIFDEVWSVTLVN